jgi:hypothetical protein
MKKKPKRVWAMLSVRGRAQIWAAVTGGVLLFGGSAART